MGNDRRRAHGAPARPPRRIGAGDGGAAAVEFALIVPLLLALVFGIISFGLIFASSLALNNGTRQAARAAVVDNRTCAQIMSEFDVAMSGTFGTTYPIDVTISRAGGGSYPGATCSGTLAENHSVTYSVGSAALIPCKGSGVADNGTPYDQLIVSTESTGTLFVPPFFPSSPIDINGKGVYRCEFS